MTTEMHLAPEEADVRIYGNDLVNAKFIKEHLDLSKHQVIRLFTEQSKNSVDQFLTVLQEFDIEVEDPTDKLVSAMGELDRKVMEQLNRKV